MAGTEGHVAVVHADRHGAAEHQEELVGVRVRVPGELAVHLDHSDVVVVERRDGARAPGLGERREDSGEIDGVRHACSMPGHGGVMNFGELGKKAKDFLDTEEGEKKSDAVFDKAAEFLDEKTGGKHAAQIDKGRDFADDHVGRTDGGTPRP
jgi:hypothetical protein